MSYRRCCRILKHYVGTSICKKQGRTRRKIYTYLRIFLSVFSLMCFIQLLDPSWNIFNIRLLETFIKQRPTLRMIVITYNRSWSLKRLLLSLNEADYQNDRVVLEIWIDRSKTGIIDEETFKVANRFKFEKGNMIVYNHSRHVGLYGQWMNTWRPSVDTKEIAVILEDDLTVSSLFYRYLKRVRARYDSRTDINGYALQVSMKHGGAKGLLRAPNDSIVFLYPVLGSWGFSPKMENWIKFLNWYKKASNDTTFQPLVPGILPTLWYKNFIKTNKTKSMWTMWHIYFAWTNNEKTLYSNFPNNQGLTINWKEPGLHVKKKQNKTNTLVTKWDARLDNLPEEPIQLDYNGTVVKNKSSKSCLFWFECFYG